MGTRSADMQVCRCSCLMLQCRATVLELTVNPVIARTTLTVGEMCRLAVVHITTL